MTLGGGALEALNALALVSGVAYAVLAARRNRICWIAGAVSAISAALLSATNRLPMQAALQVYYVGMAAYGWWSWRRSSDSGELRVRVLPMAWHLAAVLILTAASFASAYWLRIGNFAAWPLLDSLTTWFSLFATWLTARAKLENWLYWIVIDAVLVFLFYAQEVSGMALLSVVYVGIAVGGFVSWRRRYLAQAVTA